jgi:hypothetical protein
MAFLYHKHACLHRAFNICIAGGDHDARHGTLASGQSWDKAGDVEKRLPLSCRVVFGSLTIHAIDPCNGFGLTDGGHYIIRLACHCVVMSDPIEPCPAWHV